MSRELKDRALERRAVRTWRVGEVELRATGDGQKTLTGYASVFDAPYEVHDIFGAFTETVKPGAFTKTLAERADVGLLINHTGMPLARTANGSLRLSEDGHGLRVEADLFTDDDDARTLIGKIERGLMDEMSFAFRVTRQAWNEDYTERDLVELDLNKGDVSVVNYGANPATSVGVRSLLGVPVDDLSAAIEALRAGEEADLELVTRAATELAGLIPSAEDTTDVSDDSRADTTEPEQVLETQALLARCLARRYPAA